MTKKIGYRKGLLTLSGRPGGTKVELTCDCGLTFQTQLNDLSPSREVYDCGCRGLIVEAGDKKGSWTVTGRLGIDNAWSRKRLSIQCRCSKVDDIDFQDWDNGALPVHVCPWDHPLIGQRFGRLVVKYPLQERIRENIAFHAECDCGDTTTVIGADLRRGNVQSCSCLQREVASQRAKQGFPKSNYYISYGYAHSLIRKAKGDASEYRCHFCPEQAYAWNYDGTDPDEMFGRKNAIGYRYSSNPAFYRPVCGACLRTQDRSEQKQTQGL